MAMMKTGLRRGVFLFSLIAVILPFAIIGGAFLSYYKQKTTTEINRQNLHIAAIIRDSVNNALSAPRRTLSVVAGLAAHPAYAPHLDGLIARMASSYRFFESIMVLDRDGIVRHLGTTNIDNLTRQDYLGIDLSEAEHIAAARRLQQHTWSDTYISPLTGEPTLSLTIPFERGLVAGNFNFSDLTRAVEQHLPWPHDRFYLVNSKGRVIAHPRKSLVLEQVNVSDLPVVRAGLEGREGVYQYDVEGTSFIGAVAIIPETGWLVIVERDKDEVLHTFRSMQRVFSVAFVSALLLVACFLGYVHARVVKPVVEISTTTKNVTKGYFSQVPPYAGRFEELRDLTVNFNTMIAALQGREEALRQSEQLYRALINTAPDAVVISDVTGIITFVSPNTLALFGHDSADELLGRSVLDWVVPADQERALANIKKNREGIPSRNSQYTLVKKNGEGFIAEIHASVLKAADGNVTGMVAFLRDITERKRAEEALQISEERYRSLFESAGDAIVLLQEDRFVDCNHQALEMFGCSREEFLGASPYRFSPPEQPDGRASQVMARQKINAALVDEPQFFEWKHIKHDGTPFDAEVSLKRIELASGVHLQAIVRDISERKRAEEALMDSEEKLEIILANSPDAIYVLGSDGNALYANPAASLLSGYSNEELMQMHYLDIVHPEDRPALQQRRSDRLAGIPTASHYAFRAFDRSGALHWLENRVIVLPWEGKPATLNYLWDVTEKKRAEEERENLITDIQKALGEVSRSKKEWQDTFDSITDMISIHDKNFNVIKANKAFAASVGLSPQEVINRKCYDLMHHGASSPITGCPHQRTLQDRIAVSEEVFDEHTKETFSVSTYPYFSQEGEIIGSIHIARDITEEKDREMRMIMTERLASLGQMASGIAHEINNPLESVMICAEMLLMRVAKNNYDRAHFEKYLKVIDEEVLRCRDITSNMLSFSRQTTPSRSDVNLHLLLDKAIDLVGYQGRLKHVSVTKKYGEKILVGGNEGELRQVFLVLLINALDAMENKGAITVETGAEEGGAWIRISDSGPGISPENLKRIFHPFFSTKIEKGGTGLGLSIAHRIIVNHGGTLTAASEQGRGASFTITLPR
jgi:PAS domain S-box-containing protein